MTLRRYIEAMPRRAAQRIARAPVAQWGAVLVGMDGTRSLVGHAEDWSERSCGSFGIVPFDAFLSSDERDAIDAAWTRVVLRLGIERAASAARRVAKVQLGGKSSERHGISEAVAS